MHLYVLTYNSTVYTNASKYTLSILLLAYLCTMRYFYWLIFLNIYNQLKQDNKFVVFLESVTLVTSHANRIQRRGTVAISSVQILQHA